MIPYGDNSEFTMFSNSVTHAANKQSKCQCESNIFIIILNAVFGLKIFNLGIGIFELCVHKVYISLKWQKV